MFVTSQGPAPALDFAFPDVCKTPVGPVITPIPYPNLAMSDTAIPTQLNTLLMAMPAHNLMTEKPLSQGDDTGILLGLLSELEMGPSSAAMGSTNLFIGGAPAIKMTSPTKQNGAMPNAEGLTLTPSQIVMMSLR